MKMVCNFTAGMPHLDLHTLSEDWALATSMDNHWQLLAKSLGLSPSCWIDSQGDRMYGAAIWLKTRFDLDNTIKEDEAFAAQTEFVAIRKPHALSLTRFIAGEVKAEIEILSSFIKRSERGSNKKFAKVRELWNAEDQDAGAIERLLDHHHRTKALPDAGEVALQYETNRMQDFNAADFLYFKNYVRIAKAAEWRSGRGEPVRMNAERECFFYGNVDDGQVIETRVARNGDDTQTAHYSDDGRRIFLSLAKTPQVDLAIR